MPDDKDKELEEKAAKLAKEVEALKAKREAEKKILDRENKPPADQKQQ